MASCTQIENAIQAYIDGELTVAERVILEDHISTCENCRALVKKQKALNALLFETFAPTRLHHDLSARVMAGLPEMDHIHSPQYVPTWTEREEQKTRPRFWVWVPLFVPVFLFFIAVAIYAYWPSRAATDQKPTVGMVTYKKGTVYYEAADMDAVSARLGKTIAKDVTISTADDGNAVLSLAGPSHIKMAENTRIHIFSDRRIAVDRGKAWLSVSKTDRYFRVDTPTGAVTVFGTTFEVRVEENKTTVTVSEGRVQLESKEDASFVVLEKDDQGALVLGENQITKINVDSRQWLAWADSLEPNPNVLEYMQENIKPLPSTLLRAERVFKVDLAGQPISHIVVEWLPTLSTSDHVGYFIYVSDERSRALFKGYIDGRYFDDTSHTSYQMAVPPSVMLTDVKALYITLAPDRSRGTIEAHFTEVYAVTR